MSATLITVLAVGAVLVIAAVAFALHVTHVIDIRMWAWWNR